MLDACLLEMLDDLTEDMPPDVLSDCMTAYLKGHYGLPSEVPLDLN